MTQIKKILAWPYLKAGFSPLAVGLFGIIMACIAVIALRYHHYTFAFWVAMIAVLTDMADGEVARATRTATPEGNYLDALGDRLREGLLLFGLIPWSPNMIGLAILGTFLTSFAKARFGLVVISDNEDWPGFGDHPDRAVLLLICYFTAPDPYWAILFFTTVVWSCFLRRAIRARDLIREADETQLLPYLRSSELYQR